MRGSQVRQVPVKPSHGRLLYGLMCFADALWLDSDTSIRSIRLASIRLRPRLCRDLSGWLDKYTTAPVVVICSRLAR